jgi:hypothetical protein
MLTCCLYLVDVMTDLSKAAKTAGLLVVSRVASWGGLLVVLRVVQMAVGLDANWAVLSAVLTAAR